MNDNNAHNPKDRTAMLLGQYREAAQHTGDPDPKKANIWARKLHAYCRQLRANEKGRLAIVSLLRDPSPHVRVWAASHSLAWESQIARQALEELRDSGGPCSFDAEITIREFDNGRLPHDH